MGSEPSHCVNPGRWEKTFGTRHVNPHLFKYKFKCEDISTAQDLLGEGYYLYTFDIKSAYHHVEIFQSHRTYMGFQWFYQGKATYFVFNVLPFSLSTAPYIFTKLLKPLIGHWRGSGKRICMFLDDGLGGNSSKQSATVDAKAVKEDLDRLGFVLSENKCVWEPSLTQTWLGHVFNMSETRLYVTETRLSKLKESLSSALKRTDNISAKFLAQITGSLYPWQKPSVRPFICTPDTCISR